MLSIVFNMAEIKAACTYTIKNVKWYLKDEDLNKENQTLENLINAEGTANFLVQRFFDEKRYDLGRAGRYKFIKKFNYQKFNLIII